MGFALIDVLVALLLLAAGLLGACGALVQTLRATQGALLTSRAVDLVADLGEDLESVTSVTLQQQRVRDWRGRAGEVLPLAGLGDGEAVSWQPASMVLDASELSLRWQAPGSPSPSQLRIPLAAAIGDLP